MYIHMYMHGYIAFAMYLLLLSAVVVFGVVVVAVVALNVKAIRFN